MPYITQQQIEVLDDLAARLGIEDKDEWVRVHLATVGYTDIAYREDGNPGLADLSDRAAAELILQWRKDLAVIHRKRKSIKKKA